MHLFFEYFIFIRNREQPMLMAISCQVRDAHIYTCMCMHIRSISISRSFAIRVRTQTYTALDTSRDVRMYTCSAMHVLNVKNIRDHDIEYSMHDRVSLTDFGNRNSVRWLSSPSVLRSIIDMSQRCRSLAALRHPDPGPQAAL